MGEGWTGPSWERRALKARSGSEASRVMARAFSYQLRMSFKTVVIPSSLDALARV